MKPIFRNATIATLLFVMVGCNKPASETPSPVPSESHWGGILSTEDFYWDETGENTIAGVDSAFVIRRDLYLRNLLNKPIMLWTNCGKGLEAISSITRPEDGGGYIETGYIAWDAKTKCSYTITLHGDGHLTLDINGEKYGSQGGTTILLHAHDGEVEVKQIGGLGGLQEGIDVDRTSLIEYAHSNQEIVDFYGSKQQADIPQNRVQRE
tara:strand:+ start:1247 stop:1873 length:627 start_codon:yes stop_codon:yes gene_type:complete